MRSLSSCLIGCLIIVITDLISSLAFAQISPPRNVILITLDGMRWQEIYRGLDKRLAADATFNRLGQPLSAMFAAETSEASASKLFPFLHEVIAKQGVMIGNRDAGSCAAVTNPWYFSYPGYNEILTGKVDPAIDSNDAKPNPNRTFLEWLNKDVTPYQNQVMAFGSWDAFPAIINAKRSGIDVNVGPKASDAAEDKLLARLPMDLPTLWPNERLDAFTHHYALQALQKDKPRALFISYGETDEFAHEGHYEQYLLSAHRTDGFIREIWDYVQSDPFYRNNTVLFITTDHGRGEEPIETWQHHASKASLVGSMKSLARYKDGIVGSDATWMAAIGTGVPARGPTKVEGCAGSNQIAATLLTLLGLNPQQFNTEAGLPLQVFIERE